MIVRHNNHCPLASAHTSVPCLGSENIPQSTPSPCFVTGCTNYSKNKRVGYCVTGRVLRERATRCRVLLRCSPIPCRLRRRSHANSPFALSTGRPRPPLALLASWALGRHTDPSRFAERSCPTISNSNPLAKRVARGTVAASRDRGSTEIGEYPPLSSKKPFCRPSWVIIDLCAS